MKTIKSSNPRTVLCLLVVWLLLIGPTIAQNIVPTPTPARNSVVPSKSRSFAPSSTHHDKEIAPYGTSQTQADLLQIIERQEKVIKALNHRIKELEDAQPAG